MTSFKNTTAAFALIFTSTVAYADNMPADNMPKSLIKLAATELSATDSVTLTNPARAVLASQFMGQSVYSTANELVGDINDLVMDRKLDNVVAIVGVGGFLGMGEKDVAIPVEDIKAVKDSENNLRLTISQSKEQLKAAPTFDRSALK